MKMKVSVTNKSIISITSIPEGKDRCSIYPSEADNAFFDEASEKIMRLLGKVDGERFFKLIAEQMQLCYDEGIEDA